MKTCDQGSRCGIRAASTGGRVHFPDARLGGGVRVRGWSLLAIVLTPLGLAILAFRQLKKIFYSIDIGGELR